MTSLRKSKAIAPRTGTDDIERKLFRAFLAMQATPHTDFAAYLRSHHGACFSTSEGRELARYFSKQLGARARSLVARHPRARTQLSAG